VRAQDGRTPLPAFIGECLLGLHCRQTLAERLWAPWRSISLVELGTGRECRFQRSRRLVRRQNTQPPRPRRDFAEGRRSAGVFDDAVDVFVESPGGSRRGLSSRLEHAFRSATRNWRVETVWSGTPMVSQRMPSTKTIARHRKRPRNGALRAKSAARAVRLRGLFVEPDARERVETGHSRVGGQVLPMTIDRQASKSSPLRFCDNAQPLAHFRR